MTTPLPDPRLAYRTALGWTAGLAAAVRPDQLDGPTPCDGYDVRTLLRHLVTTVRRAQVIAEGRSPLEIPAISTDVPDDGLADTYAEEAERAVDAWSDDAKMDAAVTVPWGTVPGRGAVWGYVNETLVHGWDLAVSTGQPAEAPTGPAEAALVAARMAIPAEPRGGHVPFAPPVEPAAGAGATERLANWSGRPPHTDFIT
ncbi:TIGR03086 family metal-binding protein [Pseudonocardia humida]|uniref:TIGR03086 family protein n=1 Tax=Pseudonocardia humida TaxID=2800819 RepID=A0ABT0ZWL5_9PSEU|nr:TIGR03086 family metal-binding protein [Pseudonocardia humida]MCO1655053.1 TIGR03086 family protein [Pseudonocardia humida]